METRLIQQELFALIKSQLAADVSIADEIASLLGISTDSAYRRMRGEKPVAFDELHALCQRFRISLDQLMNIQTGSFLFQGNLINRETFGLSIYFKSILQNLKYFSSFGEKEYYYLCKDVPIFYHFLSRDIAAFKYFFWGRTIFDLGEFDNQKFSFDLYPDELAATGDAILDLYSQMPSVEFWNVENINIAIRQVEFYRDSRMFASDHDAFRIYDAWEKVIDHTERQAERGYKFKFGDPDMKPLGSYKLYFNEVILGDNTMMVVVDGVKAALLPHTVINYMITRDVAFCENMYNYIQSLARRSTLISEVGEKERSKFFRRLRERLQNRKESLRL